MSLDIPGNNFPLSSVISLVDELIISSFICGIEYNNSPPDPK